MTEEAYTLHRVTAPAADPPGPAAFAEDIKALHTRAAAHLDAHLHPNPPETYNEPWTQMEHIYARGLRQFIALAEYALRCFILVLAGELLGTGNGRKEVEAYLDRPEREPPRKRPYSIFAEHQEKRPAKGSFTAFSPRASAPRRGKRSPRPFEPYDWQMVDCSRLMRRLKRLPDAIANAEAHATRLAAHILSGAFVLSEEELTAPRISSPLSSRTMKSIRDPETGQIVFSGSRICGPHSGMTGSHIPTYPGFFRCLQHWYPPPDVMERADDSARSTLISLHYKATESLEILHTRLA
ncbi:MAG TPA: hypothetical protein DDZ43_13190 [Hyphomonadaceae bacterium]|nr:hypothetical protein [Ponticaulis sp.]HBH88448.1 hypothetical protein [Hyphomonadaceae bacterium]HBJ93827.1 hypothetical protein [Hyphomonadaceae bacterium]|tara:strand:- start:24225 stop:25112 length:888 start_codon:yes stop_codon:yes gene_type:complete